MNINKSEYIYPNIEFKDDIFLELGRNYFTMRTTLRKKHKGKWYKWEFHNSFVLDIDDEKSKLKLIHEFHSDIYLTLILGKVNLHLRENTGDLVFKEDKSQKTEIERVKYTVDVNYLIITKKNKL